MSTQMMAVAGQWAGPGWWPVFPLLWVALWVLVIGTVVRATRRRGWTPPWLRGGTQAGRPALGRDDPVSSAERMLAERFARGEIDEEEYWSRQTVLDATRDRRHDL